MSKKKVSVLFVCLGNICRSPTAEGVFRAKCEQAGLLDKIDIDSAGTSGWHIGSAPDPRTVKAAATRGYDLSRLRGRAVDDDDFYRFDYILAMDSDNLAHLIEQRQALLDSGDEFGGANGKVNAKHATLKLFLEYGTNPDYNDVPDPYYSGSDGFELVLDLIEEASDQFIETLKAKL